MRRETDAVMTLLSALHPGAATSGEVIPVGTRRRGPGGYLLLNVGGRLFFGAAVMIGWLERYPWTEAPRLILHRRFKTP